MWWAIGISIWLMLLVVVLGLCRAASIADHAQDQLSPRAAEERKRAA